MQLDCCHEAYQDSSSGHDEKKDKESMNEQAGIVYLIPHFRVVTQCLYIVKTGRA